MSSHGRSILIVLNFMRSDLGHMGPIGAAIEPIGLILVRNLEKTKFSELGVPSVEMTLTPCMSILHAAKASQIPYNAKI